MGVNVLEEKTKECFVRLLVLEQKKISLVEGYFGTYFNYIIVCNTCKLYEICR